MSLYQTYLTTLAASGFTPSEHYAHRFHKKTSDHTALILNLEDVSDDTCEAVYIVYGVTAIGAAPDFEQYFLAWGAADEDIKLRHSTVVTPDNQAEVAEAIRTAFAAYTPLDATAVRAAAKEKQKAFLNRIHATLKPLGYKRKANTWTKALPTGWYLEFNAQKSAYSDQFYFNYSHYRSEHNKYLPPYGGHRLTRIDATGKETTIFDWQLLSDEAVEALIITAALRVLGELEVLHSQES